MQPIRHWIIATILIGTLAASACGDDNPTPSPDRTDALDADDDTHADATFHADGYLPGN